MPNPEFTESARNFGIYSQLYSLCHRAEIQDPDIREATLMRKADPGFRVTATYSANSSLRDDSIDTFTYVPNWMDFPVCQFTFWHYGRNLPRRTRESAVHQYNIGPDGGLYAFGNLYTFNKAGQAVLSVDASLMTEDYAHADEAKKVPSAIALPTLDFIPNTDEVDHLPLTANDFHIIEVIINDIEQNKFRPWVFGMS